MIKLESISLQRGNKALLSAASAVIHPGQKVALIGANGSGKSSLFLLLQRQLGVDAGTLSIPAQWRIAHMAQEVATSTRPAIDYVLDGDSELRRVEADLLRAEQAHDDNALALLHQRYDELDGYTANSRAAQLLQGLGFPSGDFDRPANQFSGGWRIRLNLAQALMCPSDLLLLDEPTNHLDLDAEIWLEQWLQKYAGSLLLISHDRDFIDSTCSHTIHIEHGTLTSYRGNYSDFERQRAERLLQQQAGFEKQQRRIEEIHRFVARFRAKATKARQAQSRLKELERMEMLAPAHSDSPFDFYFYPPARVSDPLLALSHADCGYGGKTVLNQVQLSIHPGSRIGLLGANGAGKSTLVKTLAGQLPVCSGERVQGEHLQLGYFSQHQMEALDLAASPALHLQRLRPKASEQEIRTFLGSFNFRGDMALDPIRHFSGGEKARLALAIIVWQKPNLLLLDEPTNHLDLEMCHALTVALQGFEGAVVVVSHDRHLLRNTVDQFLLVGDGRVDSFDGDLEEYTRLLLGGRATRTAPKTSTVQAARPAAEDASGSANKKAQRQSAADLRRQLQPLKKNISKIESELAAAESELSQFEAVLADETLYNASEKARLQTVLEQQRRAKDRQARLESEWLLLQEELEALEQALQP